MSSPHPRFQNREIKLVLFDLDGTLADTAKDLAHALNETLEKHQKPKMNFGAIRPHVSHGTVAMIRAGFGIESDHPDFETYRQDILEVYLDNICRETTLFPEMDGVLETLESADIGWGIVTNKPSFLTDPLVEKMRLTSRTASIVSGDTTGNSKPHPEPIIYACREAGIKPEYCLYVGDAERDIEAGKRAGTATVTALFGYIADHDKPEQWGADDMIHSPLDLLSLLHLVPTQNR